MKRKYAYAIVSLIILISLFFPFSWKTHEDGTQEYSSLMVKYVSWNTMKDLGNGVYSTSTFKVYFFPDNQKDFETLRNEFFDS
ncbi:MAG: hypothetical protein J6V36_03545 [Clostridia bacterium]|nr:hypothetical protein [Clostridia bacterium]